MLSRHSLRNFPTLVTILILSTSSLHAQGWELVGPDSVNWRYIQRVTGRFSPSGSYELAAATYGGILTYSSGGLWDYVTLRNIPGGIIIQQVDYLDLEFPPWETDSVFIGYSVYNTEGSPRYIKHPWPVLYSPGPGSSGFVGGECWITPMSVVFPPSSDSTIYLSVCGLRRSSDRGVTWVNLDSTWVFSNADVKAVDFHDMSIVYKTDGEFFDDISLFKSTNEGDTWIPILSQLPSLPFLNRAVSLVAFGDTLVVGIRSWWTDTTSTKGILRSSNGGATWQHVYDAGRIADIQASQNTFPAIFAAGEEGVLRSTDYGLTWEIFNNGLPTNRVTSLLLSPNPDTVFVSSEVYGVLKVWSFTVDVPDEASPVKFALHQNYPNPFNPTTTFSFDIQHSSFVILKVYDLLGREIATLVETELSPGTYERTFNGSNLASGVYISQLRAGSFSQNRKIVLMK